MKKSIILFIILLVVPAITLFAANKSSLQKEGDKIEAYYFHNKNRCMTCNTVEKVTRESLKELYGDKIVLESLVFEDKKNKAIVDKFKVEGQSLFFVKGKKKIDITNDAFMNAVRKPEKLKEKIQETIASLE